MWCARRAKMSDMSGTKHRFDAVIFDLDGTLLDTLEDIADAANHVLATHGLDAHPLDDYRYFVGDGIRMLVTRILPEAQRTEEAVDRLEQDYREHYAHNWKVKTRPFDGVPEMLTALAEREVQMAVLSNKPEDSVQLCVTEYFPSQAFAAVFGDHPDRTRKPDPGAALGIAKRFGVPPARVAFLGDTSVDMQTARAAGMFAVGVPWGFRPREELERAGAHAIIETPLELLALF